VVEGDDGRRILIDAPPELRLQLLAAGIGHVDAVLFTHDHADHTHGIDDLRAVSARRGGVDVYGPADTLERLATRFSYIFDDRIRPQPGTSKPELIPTPLEPLISVSVAGLAVTPLPVPHGDMTVYGYRIGSFGYVTDAKAVPPDAIELLRGVEVLVLNALFDRPHPTHLSIGEAVEVARAIGASRTLLTHLTHRHGYAALAARLPAGVEPAYDGLTIDF
jgi:phosphoribosyl 1,2-cyclic phosphate phosphodiesterase